MEPINSNTITIARTLPTTLTARALIAELESALDHADYPPESQYGYSVEKLITEGVAFFVIWVDGEPAGCGGIQFFDGEYGELKRMYVRSSYRGSGLGKLLLQHLEDYALQHGIGIIRLETGIYQQEALGLYKRMGFQQITAFGDYQESPYNVFYEKQIE